MKKYLKKIAKLTVKQGLILGGIFVIFFAVLVFAVNQNKTSYRSVHNSSVVGIENSVTIYNSNQIEEWGVCNKITSNTCTSDVFIPTKTNSEWNTFVANHPSCITLGACGTPCTVPAPFTAEFGYSTIPHGASITAYETDTPVCVQLCNSEIRTCNNGVLSGSYTNWECTGDPCPDCSALHQILLSDGTCGCAPGEVYDSQWGECIANPCDPVAFEMFDPQTNSCICVAGTVWSTYNNACMCPQDTIRSGSAQACVCDTQQAQCSYDFTCQPGYIWTEYGCEWYDGCFGSYSC